MKPTLDSELPDDVGPDVEGEAERSRAAGLVARSHTIARAAFFGGVVAALVAGAVGLLRRRHRRSPRRMTRARGADARRSLLREASTRLVMGAAGVIGARIASELALPMLEQRIAAARNLSDAEQAEDAESPRTSRRRASAATSIPEPEVARGDGRARRRRHA